MSRGRALRPGNVKAFVVIAGPQRATPAPTRVTSSTWSRREVHPREPFRADRSGTGRTSCRPSAHGRSAGSACTRAPRTSACARPSCEGLSLPLAVLLEREAERLEQRASLVVVLRRGHDGDVHTAGTIDRIGVDLVEHRLLGETEGVVAVAVELLVRQAAEVADTGQRERQQPVEE